METVVLPGATGLGCEVSRRKSESTGPATLRQAKKKRPEAELGGPLVTMDGEVVGIVTAILNPNEQRTFVGIGSFVYSGW